MWKKYPLKNGKVISYNDEQHMYYVDDKKVASVTGICGRGVPKPSLTNWLVYTPLKEAKDLINRKLDNNEPLDVVRIDSADNTVIVGPKQALARDVITLSDCNWLDDYTGGVQVKLRSVSQLYAATLEKTDGGAVLYLDAPQYGISPGQAAVCYQGERIIGGGWIVKTAQQKEQKAA